MKRALAASILVIAFATTSPGLACDPKVDKTCCDPKVDKLCPGYHKIDHFGYTNASGQEPSTVVDPAAPDVIQGGAGHGAHLQPGAPARHHQRRATSTATGGGGGPAPAAAPPANDLVPVREFLRNSDIPPREAGVYGVIVFQSLPTPATRAKALMVCLSFVAFFPRNETLSDTIAMGDRMITIWPVDDPSSAKAQADDCDFAIDHYDMAASFTAIRDAKKQSASFDGEGPYLVGWSPSNTRGVPGQLVLVVDMSDDHNQETIDHQFLFWKNHIVQNPSLWRSGFSLEGVRVAIHDFADEYGQDMLDAIKLVGAGKP